MADLTERLAAFLSERLGGPVKLENLVLLPGTTRETWSFDARLGKDEFRLILRKDPARPVHQAEAFLDRVTEFRVVEAAWKASLPVPRPFWVIEEADLLGAPGFIMARVEGETIPRRILREDTYAQARARMASQCGEILARIHSIDPATTGLEPPTKSHLHPALPLVDQYQKMLDEFGDPHPAFEIGLHWLRHNLPREWRLTLVHGDFRNGNFIVGPEGIRAVLDWELAHVGDPMEDLGWLCVRSWRFGHDDKAVGGFGNREELFAAYEVSSGQRPDPEAVRFWEVFGNLKWGIICVWQAYRHLRKEVRSVELAAIGRRACEMEWDLLNLIR